MKKIITLLLTVVLIAVSSTTVLAERAKGLYAYNCFEEEANPEYMMEEFPLNYGGDNYYQFYYYNGSTFTEVSYENLTFVNTKVTASKATIKVGPQETDVTCIKMAISDLFDSTDSVSYSPTQGTTYTIKASGELPYNALYSSNTPSKDTLITKITNDNVNNVYVGFKEAKTLKSASVLYNGASFSDTTVSLENTTSLALMNKLTFTNLHIGYDFQLKIVDSESQEYCFDICYNYNLAKYEYQGNTYTYALAQDDPQNNLHIVDSFGMDASEEDIEFEFYLVAGKIQAATAEVAPAVLFDGISNVTCETVASSFADGDLSIEVGTSKEQVYERDAYPVTIKVNKEKAGSAIFKTSFTLTVGGTSTNISTYQKIDIKEKIVVDIALDSSYMNDPSKFNALFASDQAFQTALTTTFGVETPKYIGAQEIKVKIPSGTYSGSYVMNVANKRIVLYSEPSQEFVKAPNDMQTNQTTITGSLQIKAGNVMVNNIDFVGSDTYSNSISSLGITNKKIGIYAYTGSTQSISGSWDIRGCSFTGYDYAVLSSDSGIICDVNMCKFINCKYGYYMDSKGKHLSFGGDKSSDNVFTNCDNAVSIISTSYELPAYSLRFVNNYFFQDGTKIDFNIAQNNGVYYFRQNYYGSNMANLRTVKINKNNKNNITVITNPCIRYPDSMYPYGIDNSSAELKMRIFNGEEMVINEQDIDKISNLVIASSNGENVLGSIDITGGDK